MDVNIRQMGYAVGTSGWFKAGLADGSITLGEAVSQGGHLGLYLDVPGEAICLAVWNPTGLTEAEVPGVESFMPLPWKGCGLAGVRPHKTPFTPAVVKALQEIAGTWCDHRNAQRATDEPFEVVVTVSTPATVKA